jgi:hypothetical protein
MLQAMRSSATVTNVTSTYAATSSIARAGAG